MPKYISDVVQTISRRYLTILTNCLDCVVIYVSPKGYEEGGRGEAQSRGAP